MQLRKKNIFNDSFEDSIGFQADDAAFPSMHYKDILRLINEIPEHLKTVFNLYEIEGYKHNEIAEILSVSVGTSKSSLSRAKAMLKEKLIINGF
jgi:RNA polymerase sigma factor (sigma-70 family)